MPTFDRRRWTPVLAVVVLVLVWWLQQRGVLAPSAPGADTPTAPGTQPTGAPTRGPVAGAPPRAAAGGRYDPRSAGPADAIPGGGLAAHEGRNGGHTLDRHVGRTLDQLKARARDEAKREVSTFPDEAAADRAVAEVLYRKRTAVAAWLADTPDGLHDVQTTLDAAVGTVWRADRGRAQPGRTVVVVLAPSRAFREGFRIHTAYVTLP